MRRRDFIKTSAVAAGSGEFSEVGSRRFWRAGTLHPSHWGKREQPPEDNRSAEYLQAFSQEDKFLPKPPAVAEADRGRRKNLADAAGGTDQAEDCAAPGHLQDLAPGNGALLSGNGAVSIELAGDPYTEQIPFRHESMYAPRRRPVEAPKVADILPQVRQMLLEGKYHMRRNSPIKGNGTKAPRYRAEWEGGAGGRFTMRLEFPRTATVKDYLRTVDFESTEVKVHWTDERGRMGAPVFTSRPDNLVVQWLTAPQGQSVNVRIGYRGCGGGGRHRRQNARRWHAGAPRGAGGQSNVQQDFNEQRLILKGRSGPFGEQQGLRRSDPRGPRRRLGPDGARHAGHRERDIRHAADASLRSSRTTARSR